MIISGSHKYRIVKRTTFCQYNNNNNNAIGTIEEASDFRMFVTWNTLQMHLRTIREVDVVGREEKGGAKLQRMWRKKITITWNFGIFVGIVCERKCEKEKESLKIHTIQWHKMNWCKMKEREEWKEVKCLWNLALCKVHNERKWEEERGEASPPLAKINQNKCKCRQLWENNGKQTMGNRLNALIPRLTHSLVFYFQISLFVLFSFFLFISCIFFSITGNLKWLNRLHRCSKRTRWRREGK